MRHTKLAAWVPVAVLITLAGCGGGSDTAVSGSPAPPVATPEPGAPPPASASEPGSPPAAPPDAPSIGGSVLTTAVMASNYGLAGGAVDPNAVAPREGATDRAFVYREDFTIPGQNRGSYTLTSGPHQNSVADLPRLFLSTDWARANGDVQLAATLFTQVDNASAPALSRAAPLRIDPAVRYPLDVALGEWREDAGFDAATARLIPMTIAGDATAFRVCWQVNLPGVSRESCTRHALATGEFTGVHLVDESGEAPLRVWSTVP
ncbi:MAG: hypothetical protein AB7G13_30690 [Lautropia sp.]